MTAPDEARIVECYWEFWRLSIGDRTQRRDAEALYWAWEWVESCVAQDPAGSVSLVRDLAEAAPGDEAIAYLGAGPVEELVKRAIGDAGVRASLASAVRSSAALRQSLRSVWAEVPADLAALVGREVDGR